MSYSAPASRALLFVVALGAFASAAHAQESEFDCPGRICIKFSEIASGTGVNLATTPPTITVGTSIVVPIAFNLAPLQSEAGATFTNVRIDATFGGFLHGVDLAGTAEGQWDIDCVNDPLPAPAPNPNYRIRCTFFNPGPIVAGAGSGLTDFVAVRVRAPLGRTPDGYVPEMHATLSADTLDGQGVAVPNDLQEDFKTVQLSADANPQIELVTRTGGGMRTVTINNVPTLVRTYSYGFRLRNRFVNVIASNALLDAQSTLVLPEWQKILSIARPNTFNGPDDDTTHPPGTAGGTLTWTYDGPSSHALMQEGDPLEWNTRTIGVGDLTEVITLETYIACTDLDAPGGFGALVGETTHDMTANEREYAIGANGEDIFEIVERTTALVPSKTLLMGSLDTGPCRIGAGPGNVKRDQLDRNSLRTHSGYVGRVQSFDIHYRPPDGAFEISGPIAVIDAIPPFTHLWRGDVRFLNEAGNAYLSIPDLPANPAFSALRTIHPDFNQVYLCKLPRTGPNALHVPDPGAPIFPGLAADGAPKAYWYEPRDPFEVIDRDTGELLLPWDGTTGCSLPKHIWNPDANRLATYTGAPPADAPVLPALRAMDVTDALLVAPAGWGAAGATNPPRNLDIQFAIVTTELPADVAGDNELVANTRNIARMSGGVFADVEDGATVPRRLDEIWTAANDPMAYDPPTCPCMSVSNMYYIDNRAELFPTMGVYQPWPTGNNRFDKGDSASLLVNLTTTGPARGGTRLTVTLPPGFELSPLLPPPDPPAPTSTVLKRLANDLVEMQTNAILTDLDLGVNGVVTYLGVANDPELAAITIQTTTTPDGRDQITVEFPDTWPMRSIVSNSANRGLRIGVRARTDYPFTQRANFADVLAEADGATSGSFQAPMFVDVLPALSLTPAPICDPGKPYPAFDATLAASGFTGEGGHDVYGAIAIIKVPGTVDGGAFEMRIARVELDPARWPPNQLPDLHYTLAGDPDTTAAWVALTLGSVPPAGTTAIKLSYPPASTTRYLPGHTSGTVRLAFEPAEPLTAEDVGEFIQLSGRYGATPSSAGSIQVPFKTTGNTDPFILGQCPTTLVVAKYLDRDADPLRGDGDLPLGDWVMDVTVDHSQALDPALIDPTYGDVTAPRSATTAMPDGETAVIDVWPGETVTVRERQRDPLQLPNGTPAPYDAAPWNLGTSTLSWEQVYPADDGAQVVQIGFDDRYATELGNECACADDNLCTSDACEPCDGSEADGVCDGGVKCLAAYDGPASCEAEACYAAAICDPETGGCGSFDHVSCATTKVYIELTNDLGESRFAVCEVRDEGATVSCDNDDDGFLDLLSGDQTFCGQ